MPPRRSYVAVIHILITYSSQPYVLAVRLRKTEVAYQPVAWKEHRPPHVAIDDVDAKSTQLFSFMVCVNWSVAGMKEKLITDIQRQRRTSVDGENVIGSNESMNTK